ncbi:DUF4112 domain-containing protein [Occallatibacter savannae]|uniref:DUF4112 domain-containing protein n=1 Tax=Occallatibacter savannae TaxID=1002691 RepID=UPI000D688778|nr:DUF4112 domain-containing protein [Occallatibacter savannae]
MPAPKANSPRINCLPGAPADGTIVPSERWERGAWIFRDETLRGLEILLDEAFRIPFTGFRFGIDGIIGLVPGLGDVIAGLLSLVIPIAAWTRGVPYVALARMAVNVGIGVLVGSIPLIGDAFDIAFKPNRRNYQLMQRHIGQPRRHTWKDWAFLAALICAIAIVFAIPIAVFVWLLIWLNQHTIIR